MRFNYTYNGTPIQKSEFIKQVPITWMDELDEWGEYSWGYYRASKLDEESMGYDSTNLINWSEVSRLLTGNREQIRSTYPGKMYRDKVDRLKMLIKEWYEFL